MPFSATASPTSSQQVAAIYAGLLGRAADPGGLAYWSGLLDKGLPLDGLVDGLLGSAEAKQLFSDPSPSGFVTALYQSAFGRAPEAAGLQYWTGILSSMGGSSDDARSSLVDSLLGPMITGTAPANANADQQAFANRTDASLYFAQNATFTVTLDNARKIVAVVTADPVTVTTSKNATDHGGVVTTPTGGGATTPETHSTTAINFTPNAGTAVGSSDASSALALGGNTVLVGDDEASVLRVYSRDGGAALKEIDYSAYLGTGSNEVDLEASARIGDTLYFIGSHSNNKNGVDQPGRDQVFSATVTGSGATTALAFTGKNTGLETALKAWDHTDLGGNLTASGKAVDYYGMNVNAAAGIPERDAGFSIEGLTFSPDNSAMWLGFRAPDTGTSANAAHKALIVPVTNFTAMLGGATPVLGTAIELDLGGRGIRSIDKSADGQYIIIAGPSGGASSDVPDDFRLYTWDGHVTNGQADHLFQRAANLDPLLATTGGSFESMVEVPSGTLTDSTWIQLLQDDGDTTWPGNGSTASKDLAPGLQHFNGNWVQLGAVVGADTTAPLMTRSTPAANATGVSITGTKAVLSFNEAVHAGTGNILLKVGGTTQQTIAVNDTSKVTFEYNTVTVDLTGLLTAGQTYTMEIAATGMLDAAGNAYAGLDTAHAISFTTVPAGTTLNTGDIAFVGFNTDGGTDAFAFVLLKDVAANTTIHFTDNEWTGTAINSGESDYVWTSGGALTAGTVITVQPDQSGSTPPVVSTGSMTGSGGGLGKTGEQILAFTGTVASPGTFLGAIGMGSPSGGLLATGADLNKTSFVPTGLTLGTNAVNVSFINAKYTGITTGDAATLLAAISDSTHWTSLGDTTPAAITGNQMTLGFSGLTVQGPTTLTTGDIAFVGFNTSATAADAYSFVLLKDITTGTAIRFTDKEWINSASAFNSGESDLLWTSSSSLTAGTVVTIQPNSSTASTGTLTGSGGGLGSPEQVFAMTGTVAAPGTFLAGIGMKGGIASGSTTVTDGSEISNVPTGLTLGSNVVNVDSTYTNAKYTGITTGSASDLLTAISTASNWTDAGSTGLAITGNKLDVGFTSATVVQPTVLSAGDVLFLALNSNGASRTDAFAFTVTKAITAGTTIGFTDRDYNATTMPTNESVYIWKADQAYAAGTIITVQPDVASGNPIVSAGSAQGVGGGLSSSAESVYAFQGTVDGLGTGTGTLIHATTWLGGIHMDGVAALSGDVPAGVTMQQFTGANAIFTASTSAADIAAFKALVLDHANWTDSGTLATLTGTAGTTGYHFNFTA